MPTVIVEQVRPTVALAARLEGDAAITVQWAVNDEHSRPISSQTCTLTVAGQVLTAAVPANERKYSFRLSKGMQVNPMTVLVHVDFAAAGAQAAGPGDSAPLAISAGSASEPDLDGAKTVYGELNQELRRTRTLYETFLVIVTGALATVFSKRSDIAGAYRPSFAYGLGFLALIVIYMIWQIAQRYRNATAAIFNLECSWGLRSPQAPEYPLDSSSSGKAWWVDDAWRHTIWAIGLTLYALLAIGIVINFLKAPPEPAKAAAPSASVVCSCAGSGQDQRAMPTTPISGTSSRHTQSPAGKTKKK